MMLSGKEDAANNFARGMRHCSKMILGSVVESVRNQTEACDNLQGFMIYHSFGGGTGSGLHAAIIEYLSDIYAKKCKIEVAVFPSPTVSRNVLGFKKDC